MHGDFERHSGWELREAVRRTVDSDVLAKCITAERAWRKAGAPTRFSWRNRETEGEDAALANAVTRERKRHYDVQQAAARDVANELTRLLIAGRLVGWGKRESRLAKSEPIPSSAWRGLRFTSYRHSIVAEIAKTETQVFEVRIYPVVEAPDALDHLVNKTIVEACQRFVFEDPQLTVLRKRAAAVGGNPAPFGFQLGPHGRVWPVIYGSTSAWDSPIGYSTRLDEPKKYSRTRAADHVLGQRFARFIRYLANGDLIAEGVPRRGGLPIEVARSFWMRKRTRLDLINGDLLEFLPDARDETEALSRPLFMGLILRKQPASMFHVKSTAHVGIPSTTIERKRASPKKSLAFAERKQASSDACVAWLVDMMRASPNDRQSIESLWVKANKKWPGTLSKRAFLRARDEAIDTSGATPWRFAGAPKKSPRDKALR